MRIGAVTLFSAKSPAQQSKNPSFGTYEFDSEEKIKDKLKSIGISRRDRNRVLPESDFFHFSLVGRGYLRCTIDKKEFPPNWTNESKKLLEPDIANLEREEGFVKDGKVLRALIDNYHTIDNSDHVYLRYIGAAVEARRKEMK